MLKNVLIESFSDIVKNPNWLHGKTPEQVLKKLGDTWKEVKSRSIAGGKMYYDGKNYLEYNPGNPGSAHGGVKWRIPGNNADGKTWIGVKIL